MKVKNMELENIVENEKWIIDYFGYFPKFHDSEIEFMNFEISKSRYYPTITLSISTTEKEQDCKIILEFINVVENSACDFGNQNSIYEMNFSRQEKYVKCVIEPNCGLSAEILCEKIRVVSFNIDNAKQCFKVKTVRVNNNDYEVESLKKLQELFARFDNVEYKEFQVCGYDNTSLFVVMNKENSLCIYHTGTNEDSYHIYNPNGNPEKYETFIISNGQADEYEEINLVDNQTAYSIIRCFFDTGTRYDKVIWELD